MTFCINKNIANDFKSKLKSGEVDPVKLAEMSSKERRAIFAKYLGENNAEKTNALFESKLLLKNRQKGLVAWAKKVTGISPEAKQDLVSRINRMDKILTPKDEKAFLEDLAAQRLDVRVTMGEASQIYEMAKKTSEAKAKITESSPIMSQERMEYGRALYDLGEYTGGLKQEAQKTPLTDYLNPVTSLSKLGGLSKSLKASFDNSAIGRQGLKTLWSHPKIWLKNSAMTFVDMYRTFGGRDAHREIMADILSRPNALNGLYKQEKLAIGVVEEAYPTSLPGKIPVLGRAFRASEAAFRGWSERTRADVFDLYVETAKKSGAEIEGIGKIVNSLTGRGTFGPKGEAAASAANNLFFSARFLKSNIDLLTVNVTDKGVGKLARRKAAENLVKVIGGTALVLKVADTLSPGSVEWDPRSSDFGKIKVDNTRFDVTGGLGSIVVLAARLISGKYKSSTTGIVKEYGSGFGEKSRWDAFADFITNKFSPLASVIKENMEGRTFSGEKPSVKSNLMGLFAPIPLETPYEAFKDPNSAGVLLTTIMDQLGFGANTYGLEAKWTDESDTMQQFKEKVGDKEFRKANESFNTALNAWFTDVSKTPQFTELSEEMKTKVIDNKKRDLKKQVLRSYGFRARRKQKVRVPNL